MLKLLKDSKVLLLIFNIIFIIETLSLFLNTAFTLGGMGNQHIDFTLSVASIIVLLQFFMLIVQFNYFDKMIVVILSIFNVVLNAIMLIIEINNDYYFPTVESFLVAIFISLFFICKYYKSGETK